MAIEIRQPLVDDIISFYDDYYRDEMGELAQNYPSEQRALAVSHMDLARGMADLADDYITDTKTITAHLEAAVEDYPLPIDVDLSDAKVRVTDLPDAHHFDVGHYAPNDVRDKLVGLRGQVSKRGQRTIRSDTVVFECQRCGTTMAIPQRGQDLETPHECMGCERQGPFIENPQHSDTDSIDFQVIRLQELPEKADTGTGTTIDIELSEDLVGSVKPGDRVLVNAMVRGRRKDSNSRVEELYGEAKSVERLEADHEDIDIEPYKERIEEIADPNMGKSPFEALVQSIAPTHKGDEQIKEALALQMFGGVDAELPDGSHKDGNIHICLVGSPGTGKSTLMNYISRVVPRAVTATGKGSTTAGLTAAAVQSDFEDGGWTVEAGALVEANNGICCVDELDKMEPTDRDGMLETMSDQRVSVSKAGITTTLPANTTILSAANPKYGSFNEFDSYQEQIDLSPVLLSRFDLMFVVFDEVGEERDREIVEHMTDTAQVAQETAAGTKSSGKHATNVTPEIEPEVLRAYVAYGKQIDPIFTDEAKETIADDYVGFRNEIGGEEDVPKPATPRAVEAIQSLSEASARARLSDMVEVADVERAIGLHREYLTKLGKDYNGNWNANMLNGQETKTQNERKQLVKKTVAGMEDETDDGAPTEDVLDELEASGIERSKAEHEIQKLMRPGDLYEPRTGHLRAPGTQAD